MGNLNLNIDEIKPVSTDYSLLPAGWYEAWIDEAEVKTTKAGNGQYLKVRYEILEGEYANAKVFQNYTVKHANSKAVEIGLGQLSKLCKDLGMAGIVDDSSELLNKRVMIKVGIQQGTGDYGDQNKVVDTKPAAGVKAAQQKLAAIVGSAAAVDDEINF